MLALTAVLTLLFIAHTTHADTPSCESFSTLDKLAKAAGKKYYGTATDNIATPPLDSWSHPDYLVILGSEFGQITPANAMKWGLIHPQPNVYNWTGADQIVQFAKNHSQIVRGHNLNWYNQNPDWLTNGNWTHDSLLQVLTEHITTVVSRYKGQIYAWDVVNEIFLDDGTWRPDIWYNTTGMDYVYTAFKAARAADPDVKLYMNDYNIEGINNKSLSYINLIKNMTAMGIKVDGIGLQSHFVIGSLPTTIEANMRRFAALGLELALTELDIRGYTPVGDWNMTQQAHDWANAVNACINVCACVGITVWDFADPYSWVPSTFAGQGFADQWDENLLTKPSYWSAAKALAGYSSLRDWPSLELSNPYVNIWPF